MSGNKSNVDLIDQETDETLSYTQGLRRGIIRSLMPNGQMPSDHETLNLMLRAAGDMDKAVLTKTKIKSEARSAETTGNIQAQLAEILLSIPTSGGAAHSSGGLELPGEFSVIETVDGETSVGQTRMLLDDFIPKVGE